VQNIETRSEARDAAAVCTTGMPLSTADGVMLVDPAGWVPELDPVAMVPVLVRVPVRRLELGPGPVLVVLVLLVVLVGLRPEPEPKPEPNQGPEPEPSQEPEPEPSQGPEPEGPAVHTTNWSLQHGRNMCDMTLATARLVQSRFLKSSEPARNCSCTSSHVSLFWLLSMALPSYWAGFAHTVAGLGGATAEQASHLSLQHLVPA
jgi:hypothetical protein